MKIKMTSIVKTLCVIGIIWTTHWLIIQLYAAICAPVGFVGLLNSFLLLGSPTCQFLNYVQYHLSTHYVAVLASMGVSVLAFLT